MTNGAHGKGPNPFVGPRAFQQGEPIYGRDSEVLQLRDLLIAERIVLLYSPSGAGKTSLIQAGLVPELEDNAFDVLPVARIGLDPGGDRTVSNRYLTSLLLSLDGDGGGRERAADLGQLSLAAYLERRGLADGKDNQLLVVDALEELLTLDPTDGPTKERFMVELGEALRDRDRWALLAVREDYLGALEPYLRHVPTRLTTTFRLNLLEAPGPRAGGAGPPPAAGVAFSDAAAERLVDNLRSVQVQRPEGRVEEAGPYVEPVQLQVVCRRLWERLPADAEEISLADVLAVGDVDRALADYYAEQVAAVAARTGVRERTIREWFDRELITDQGFRGQVLQGPSGPGAGAVRLLEDAHLIRAEQRQGATWFELTHDRLVQPIRNDNAAWREQNLTALQRQAVLWDDEHRSEGLLLRGDALAEAEQRLRDEPVELSDTERQFLDACRALAAEEREAARRQRRLRWLTVGLAVLLVLTLVTAGVALQQRNLARSASARASAAARLVTSRQLTDDAVATLGEDPRAALLLGIAAQRLNDDADTRSNLLHSLLSTRYAGTLGGHRSVVNKLAFSPDGRILATVSDDRTAILWDVARRVPLGAPLVGHHDKVASVAFSHDGRTLATGSTDRTVILWDVARRAPLGRPLVGHTDTVWSVAFSPDDRMLASSGRDGKVLFWDVARRTAPTLLGPGLKGHLDTYSVAFSPDGRMLATASGDHTASVWDVRNPAQPRRIGKPLRGHTDKVASVAFSPDGRILATGSSDTKVLLWDMHNPADPRRIGPPLEGHDLVHSVAFSPDGRILASGSSNATALLWDVHDPAQPRRIDPPLSGHHGAVFSVAFSPDGRILATGSGDATALLWDLDRARLTVKPAAVLDGQQDEVTALSFSPDGRTLATAGAAGSVVLWGRTGLAHFVQSGPPVTLGPDGLTALAFSPDGRTLATADEAGNIVLLDPSRRARIGQLPRGHNSTVNTVAFSPDGRTLASGDDDGKLILWDVAGRAMIGSLVASEGGAVNAVAFSRDERTLASGGDSRKVILWDVPRRTAIAAPLSGQGEPVNALAFSPDGRTLASGGDDSKVILWDVARRAPIGPPLGGHGGPVSTVAFSPDGRTLASGAEDTKVQVLLWNIEDLTRPTRLEPVLGGHTRVVTAVAFAPDGRILATGSEDHKVILWDLAQFDALRDAAVGLACSITGGLDRGDWSRYVSEVPYESTCSGQP
jgi:WD40 repeat protein